MTKHYDKAPITEAIIDIQVKATEPVTLNELSQLQGREGSAYPDRKPLQMASVTFGEEGEEGRLTAQTSKDQRGWAFIDVDKRHVWQARVDGFSLSRLAPYENWEPFRAEARRLWSLTREMLQPAEVTRVAVRYVNRLELPLPIENFKDYLRTVPEVSPDLPQNLTNFFLQIQILLEDIGAMVTINQTVLPPSTPEVELTIAAMLLDIDIYKIGGLPSDEDGLWAFFEQLHRRKNEVFEGCITDRTRELIS